MAGLKLRQVINDVKRQAKSELAKASKEE